jgi:lactate 2-monooxygenase
MYHNLHVFPSLRCHSYSMKPYNILAPYVIYSITIALVSCQSAQELIDAVLNPPSGSSRYASYGSEIYINHTLYNTTPVAPTNYDRLEASAKLLLPPAAYDYAAGGAGLEKTVAANREAFDKVSLIHPFFLEKQN